MIETNKRSEKFEHSDERSESLESYFPLNDQSKHLHLNPIGSVQRFKPRKRDAIGKIEPINVGTSVTNESEEEEFDSDQHIENSSDWHDELDVVKMPHLLGPSATKYSPVPVEYQHLSIFSAPAFSCQNILVEFIDSKPQFSLVPCTFNPNNHFDRMETIYFNQF